MMKKRHILHWAMGVILTPLLGSCTSDDVVGGAGREECDIILGQPMTVTSATRATDGSKSSTQFEQDEIVWLWANKTNDTGYITAWQLTAQSGGNLTGSSAKYWPSDGSKLNVYALHGNFKNSTITEGSPSWSNLSLTHTVETNQTSPENKRLSDLLFAEKAGATHGNNVELSFSHLLAKITVKLDLNNSEGIESSELNNATVTLTNIQPKATISNKSLTENSEKTNTTGTHTTITAGKITSSISSGDVIGSAIVPLQNFGGKNDASQDNVITIMLTDGRSFSYKPTSYVALSAGMEYTYTLRIIGNKITGSLSVSPFSSEADKPISFKDYFDYLADLKNRADLGRADAPHDLSYDYNGQMNTANCYVVTHPGYYKFPLVYGNAIKNGATNAIAYGVKDGTRISSTFVNHLDRPIEDPYIYKNSGCTVGSAALVWQDAPNLITNIELSDDKKFIKFEIKRDNIEQGNAVIAVKDGSGKIMWSWHIWVTNKNVYETQAVTASYNSQTKTFMFMPFPLGWNDSTTAPTCTFYQWGRKDPFPPSDGSLLTSLNDKTVYKYDTSGNSTTSDCWYKVSSQADIATSILTPSTFYYGSYNWCSLSSNELWNVGNSETDVNFNSVTKSVYDPSPAGFRLPETAAFTGFPRNGTWNNDTKGYTFTTNSVNTYWQACGYRNYNSGSLVYVGSYGYYWSAGPYSDTRGCNFHFSSSYVDPDGSHNPRVFGFTVRPVSE